MCHKTNRCRLCLDTSHDFKALYDESGRGNELYDITTNYFHPMILNMSLAKHLRGICLACWRHIWGFHHFQKSIVEAQAKLVDIEEEEDVVTKTEYISREYEEGSPSSLDNVSVRVFSVKVKDEFGGLTGSAPVIGGNDSLFSIDVVKTEAPHKEVSSEDDGNVPTENQEATAASTGGAVKEHDIITLPKLELIYMLDDGDSCSDDQCMQETDDDILTEGDDRQAGTSHETDKPYPLILVTVGKEFPNKTRDQSKAIALPKLEIVDVPPDGESSSDGDLLLTKSATKVRENQRIKDLPKSTGAERGSKSDTSETEEDDLPEEDDDSDDNHASEAQQRRDDLDDLLALWMPSVQCVVCSEYWPTFSLLRQHFRQQHPHQDFYILCCNCKFNIKSKIQDHLLLHTNPNAFRCKLCGRCHTSKYGLNRHMTTIHTGTLDKRYVCHKCDKDFATKKGLHFHDISTHNPFRQRPTVVVQADGNSVYTCNECGYICKLARTFSRHRWYKHKIEAKHKCTVCSKLFRSKWELNKHLPTHTRKGTHPCDFCPRTFKYSTNLSRHRQNKHSQESDRQAKTNGECVAEADAISQGAE